MSTAVVILCLIVGLILFVKSKTKTFSHDLWFLKNLIISTSKLKKKTKGEWSVADLFEETVDKHSSKEGLVWIDPENNEESVRYTWKEVEERANSVANWAVAHGITNGDTIALLGHNSDKYMFLWIGLAKVGATIALINYNLKHKQLLHTLKLANAKCILVEAELAENVSEAKEALNGDWMVFNGSAKGFIEVDPLINAADTSRPPRSLRAGLTFNSTLFLMYTSGTTGMPKAAKIKHFKFLRSGYIVEFFNQPVFHEQQRIYITIPLYHGTAGLVGQSTAWTNGWTIVLRKKFSASNYFKEISLYRCTLAMYVGEICRYVLQTPASDWDRKHALKLVVGNGLRPHVWSEFKDRFAVPFIGELYAATEGNSGLINAMGKTGAIGWISPLLSPVFPLILVKYNVEKGELVRDKNGKCILCKNGDVGEMLTEINVDNPIRQFDGYTDKEATEKKIVCDVKKAGDRWFRTGDLARLDDEGCVFFVDRTGDTFKWKGETVSTCEVESILHSFPGVIEVTVYGVTVNLKQSGRAGMACLVVDKQFDLEKFYKYVMSEMTAYAAPLFLRLTDQLEVTGTFKIKKTELAAQAFHLAQVTTDPLYFRADNQKQFVTLTPDLYQQLTEDTIRF